MRWTPSALPRLALCLGPAVLPHAEEATDDMLLGKEKHAHIERVNNGTPPLVSLQEVPAELRASVAEMDVESLPLGQGWAEVALALNLDRRASRYLGRGLTREEVRAQLQPDEMGMIVDWIAASDGTLWVVDWKTGAAEHLAPAQENLQLLTYMVAALLCPEFQAQEVRGALVRVDRPTPHWERTEPMDALDAGAFLGRLQNEVLDKAEQARVDFERTGRLPRLAVGEQCAWCPSRRFCPAQVTQVRQLMAWQIEPAQLTPAEAGVAYQRVVAGLALLKRLKADLEGLARQVPLPMPDGQLLAWEEESSASIDAEKAAPVLRQLYGPDVLKAATKRGKDTMPWDLLKETLAERVLPELRQLHAQGRLPKKPSKEGLLREVRARLEAAQAVVVKTYAAPRVVEAPRTLQAGDEEQNHPEGDA
jgi:hypothetical protein